MAKKVLDRLQCPSARSDRIVWLIEHHMMMLTFGKIDNKRKFHWYHHPWFTELLQLFWLDIAGTNPSNFSLYDEIVNDYNIFLNANPRPVKPLVSGDEVMEILGIEPGEKVGEVINKVYEAQKNKEITLKREAIEYVKKMEKN